MPSIKDKLTVWNRPVELTVFLPDTHVPYQDTKSYASILHFLKDTKPDRVVIMGDFMDCMPVAKWDKDPRGMQNLQEELDGAKDLLGKIRTAVGKRSEIVYLEGNHEARLTKFLMRQASQLMHLQKDGEDVLSIPHLLDLAEKGIPWVPFEEVYELYNWIFEHGDCASSNSGYTANKMLTKRRMNVGIGHTHRVGVSAHTGYKDTLQGVEFGCLIDRAGKGASYAKFPNWQQAVGVGEYHRETAHFQVVPIPLQNHSLIFGSKLYSPEGVQ